MPLEIPYASISNRVAELNRRYRYSDAFEVLRHSLTDPNFGPVALVSSFGAESVVLLHMVSEIDKNTPIIFIDTRMLFPQTLAYQNELATTFGLSDVRQIRTDLEELFRRDTENLMHRSNSDACCALRKTEPLQNALSEFDTWISGRKRYQGGSRSVLDYFESENDQRIKVNPLANWSPEDVASYIDQHNLPRHPLVAKGFKSIGCFPCTTPVGINEDDRAGRWRGEEKSECGIHFDASGGYRRSKTESTNVIVNDDGFCAEDWNYAFHEFEHIDALSAEQKEAVAIDLPNDTDGAILLSKLHEIDLIRIGFPSIADGRGFSLARQLRTLGYHGRLRAKGHVISDQYEMARRSGFDEVEIDANLAKRQPEAHWLSRKDWQNGDYQRRLLQSL